MKKPPRSAGEEQSRAVVPAPEPVVTELPGGNMLSQAPGQQPHIQGVEPNGLRSMGGSAWSHFNEVLLNETLQTMHVAGADPADTAPHIAAASAALAAFKPADEIEGMLAAQAVALHFGAMECLRRGMIKGQSPEVASKVRKDGANLARAMTDMLDALDRKRGKGPQVVRVERVVVHEGGQAVVGNVHAGAAVAAPVPLRAIEAEQPGPVLNLVSDRIAAPSHAAVKGGVSIGTGSGPRIGAQKGPRSSVGHGAGLLVRCGS